MGSRVKEDERNERIIRNLLKLPENRRCINCNSLGPQYVCTNFSTFVCTNCSGIHREFTHRVKSISMAKFTPQEVSALQGGGNASAREIYLKEWDSQRNSLPDGSNVERLRDFIKHVYVDRRYTGERNSEKPLREKMGEAENLNGNRRMETYQGGRSPPYEDRFSDRSSTGGKSPAYDQENWRSGYKSPARAEVVNDWRREDRFGNGRRSEDRSSDGSSKVEGRSPDRQRDFDMPSPPVVRPVREILGENVTPLRVIEPPKANVAKSTDGLAHTQSAASSSSLPSADANPPETKVEASFIDFDSVPEPPVTTTSTQTQPQAADASATHLATSSDNWANFDSVPPKLNSFDTVPAKSNSLESLLSDLSIPASVSASASASAGPSPAGTVPLVERGGLQGLSSGPSFGIVTPSSVIPPAGGSLQNVANASAGGQRAMSSQQQSVFPGGIGLPIPQPAAPLTSGSSNNMPWNPLVASNIHGPPAASNVQTGQAEKQPAIDTSTGFSTEPPPNVKSGGRKELPADLFSMNFSNFPSQSSGWYSGSPYYAGVPMPYNMPMAVPSFQQPSRSTNPFDVGSEPSSLQQSTFPSVASIHGALPKVGAPSGLHRTASLGTVPSHTAPPQFAQPPSYAPSMPPSSFLGQEIAGNMTFRPQGGLSGFSLEDTSFTSLNSNHQMGALHPAHSAPNLPSMGGNPFG